MTANRRLDAVAKLTLVLVVMFVRPTVSSAQVTVIVSGGFRAVYSDVLPDLERSIGVKVNTISGASQGDGPNTIPAQLRRNVPADVVIMNRVGLTDLIAERRIVAGTDVDLAETQLGVAVRAGASKPNISTVESFRQALLRARVVAIDSSTTGIYLTTKLFPRLGIADAMAKKTVTADPDAAVAGDTDLAIRPVSELLPVKGLDVVGKVPSDLQYMAVFAAAVVTGSNQVETSKRLIAFLASAKAATAISHYGMERPRAR